MHRLGKRVGTAGAFDPVATMFAAGARRRVERGVDPEGVPHRLRSPLTASIAGGPKPGRDTGQMIRSLTGYSRQHGRSVILAWGSPLAYALTYDRGATITPRPPGRMLAIPLTMKARKYGALEYPARLFMFPFDRREKPRSLVEFTCQGVVAVYALQTETTVPARPFLPPSKADMRRLKAHLDGMIKNGLRGRV